MANELDRLEVHRLAEPYPPEWGAFLRSVFRSSKRRQAKHVDSDKITFVEVHSCEITCEDVKAVLDGLDDDARAIICRHIVTLAEHRDRDRELLSPLRCYNRIIFGADDLVHFYRGSPLADYLAAEFGWYLPGDPADVTTLDLVLISLLLRFRHHIDRALTEPARQEVLRNIAAMKATVLSRDDRHLFAEFLSALDAFPRPSAEPLASMSGVRAIEHETVPALTTPCIVGSKSFHLRALGWSKSDPGKLNELVAARAIRLEEIPSPKPRGRSRWRMWVLDPEAASGPQRSRA